MNPFLLVTVVYMGLVLVVFCTAWLAALWMRFVWHLDARRRSVERLEDERRWMELERQFERAA